MEKIAFGPFVDKVVNQVLVENGKKKTRQCA